MPTNEAMAPSARWLAPLAVVLTGASLLMAAPAQAAQGPVGLGTADRFAVLAGSGITNTGPTTITGDVGTFPTPSETGFNSITLHGTDQGGDAVTQGAKNDLVSAYDDAFGRKPVTHQPVELGGSTLLAGVYTSPTFGLTGTLTLDAKGNTDAEFIFQAGSTLITATDSRVLLANGADPCHVVWQVGSSATFDTRTQFVGDVLAQTSITAVTGATFQGRLLARDGAVTLDTNTITRANCAAPGTGPTTTSGATTSTVGGTTGTTTTGGTKTASSGTSATTVTGGSPTTSPPASGTPSSPGTPGWPIGVPMLAPGTPAGTPGAAPPAITTSLQSPPLLASTGARIFGLLATGFGLLALGALAVRIGRRNRTVKVK